MIASPLPPSLLLPTLQNDKQAHPRQQRNERPPVISAVFSSAAFIYTPHLPSISTLSVYHPRSVTSICWSLAVFCQRGIMGGESEELEWLQQSPITATAEVPCFQITDLHQTYAPMRVALRALPKKHMQIRDT